MNKIRRYNLVLAIYPNSRGFAFAAFEGSFAPYDWGVKEVRRLDKNKRCLDIIETLIERLEPSLIVLQDMSAHGTRRAQRITYLNACIAELAYKKEISLIAYSRARVRETFGEPEATKGTIAQVLVKHIPAFERYLPPGRKPWMSEDARMGLFDAAALAVTFFHSAANDHEQSIG